MACPSGSNDEERATTFLRIIRALREARIPQEDVLEASFSIGLNDIAVGMMGLSDEVVPATESDGYAGPALADPRDKDLPFLRRVTRADKERVAKLFAGHDLDNIAGNERFDDAMTVISDHVPRD